MREPLAARAYVEHIMSNETSGENDLAASVATKIVVDLLALTDCSYLPAEMSFRSGRTATGFANSPPKL